MPEVVPPPLPPPPPALVSHTKFKDTLASMLAQELSNIRVEREKRRSLDAKNEKISVGQKTYDGDKIRELSISISLPVGPPWHVDDAQALWTVDGDTLKLETALEDYHQLAVFLERHYWNVNFMAVKFQFRTAISSTALVQSIRKCLRMLVSLDRDMLFKFAVTLASFDVKLVHDGRDEILRNALAIWIAEIFKEMNETRKAGFEIEGLYSSRKRDEGDPKEEGFNFGF